MFQPFHRVVECQGAPYKESEPATRTDSLTRRAPSGGSTIAAFGEANAISPHGVNEFVGNDGRAERAIEVVLLSGEQTSDAGELVACFAFSFGRSHNVVRYSCLLDERAATVAHPPPPFRFTQCVIGFFCGVL